MSDTQTLTRAVTIEEVLADPPPEDRRWEIVRGELVIEMPTAKQHARILPILTMILGAYVRDNGLGVIYGGEPGFILERDPDTLRAADLAFVSNERMPEDEQGFFEGPPDLAIEIVSPNDRPHDVHAKADQWLDHGTRLVWVFWPDSVSVTEYRPGQPARELHADDSLEGAEVLPGFRQRVGAMFK